MGVEGAEDIYNYAGGSRSLMKAPHVRFCAHNLMNKFSVADKTVVLYLLELSTVTDSRFYRYVMTDVCINTKHG